MMSSANLDLKLNLSPPRVVNNNTREALPQASVSSSSSSEMSPKSSCVSSEAEQLQEDTYEINGSMLLVGCPRCLMYVMLSDVDPKCPKCKSTVLLDILSTDENPNPSSTTTARKAAN